MDFEVVESSEDLGSGLDLNRKGLEDVMDASKAGKNIQKAKEIIFQEEVPDDLLSLFDESKIKEIRERILKNVEKKKSYKECQKEV